MFMYAYIIMKRYTVCSGWKVEELSVAIKNNNVHSSVYKCILDGATCAKAARTTSPTIGHTEKLKRKLADLG